MSVLGFGLAALLVLSSCAPKSLEITAVPLEKPNLVVPNVDVLSMRNIQWYVITEDNYKQVLKSLKKDGRPLALFAITDKGYADLGLNLSDIRAMIQQQKAVIAAYKGYYTKSQELIDSNNNNLQQRKSKAEQEKAKGLFGSEFFNRFKK